MNATEKVINDLNVAKNILCNPQMLSTEMCIKIGQAITSAIAMLKEQEAVHVKKQEPVDPVLDYWRANFGSHYKCGNCGSSLGYIYESRFCKRCGREVDWGD